MHITILRKDIGDFHLWNADFRLTGMVISNGRTGDGFHSGILTVVILVMSISLIFSFTSCGSSTKVNFHDLHDEYCDNLEGVAFVNKKGTTLSIIVSKETTTYSYYEPAETAVKKINKALGFSDSLWDEMKKMTIYQDDAVETNDDNGVTVVWNNDGEGISIVYEKEESDD